MAYIVIEKFFGKKENRMYEVGKSYPGRGIKPTKARIKELSTDKNACGRPFIKEK